MLGRTTRKTTQDLSFGRRSRDGYTLAEMLVAAAVLAVVGVSMGALFSAGLRVYEVGQDRDSRCRNANVALVRMRTFGRVSNRLFVPNVTNPKTTAIAFASMIDDDGDGLFNEDPPNYIDTSQAAGIKGVDDDGDEKIDEGDAADDDEDGRSDEDPINGIDDDKDGRTDEDPPADRDWVSGSGVTADPDDDGDGKAGEDPYQPIVYYWDCQGKKLYERHPTHGENVIAEDVEAFEATVTVGAHGQCLVNVHLVLHPEGGEKLEARGSFFVRNASEIGLLPAPNDPEDDPDGSIEPPDDHSEPDPPDLGGSDSPGVNPFARIRARLKKARKGKGKGKDDDDDDDDNGKGGKGKGKGKG